MFGDFGGMSPEGLQDLRWLLHVNIGVDRDQFASLNQLMESMTGGGDTSIISFDQALKLFCAFQREKQVSDRAVLRLLEKLLDAMPHREGAGIIREELLGKKREVGWQSGSVLAGREMFCIGDVLEQLGM